MYRHIAEDLRERIDAGEWPVDAKMPTYDELKKQYKASKGTIDKALGVLRDLGIAETIHGMGTFVRTPPPSESELAGEVRSITERLRVLEERVGRLEDGRDTRR